MNGFNFILLGAAGFVAPRHLRAILANSGRLVAAADPCDSVGILDRYFPNARFFTDTARLERYVDLLRSRGTRIHFVSICSPNYLHDDHCRFAMRIGADAICEKPLTLRTRNLYLLHRAEIRYHRRVNLILQLRLNDAVQAMRAKIASNGHCRHAVKVHYSTPRGRWYQASWKGDPAKSGGMATNIGIHLFDLAVHLFGKCRKIELRRNFDDYVSGRLDLERADLDFALSIRRGHSPTRVFEVDGERVDLSKDFESLHDRAYSEIMAGRGYGISDVVEATRICEAIRNHKGGTT